MKSIFNFIFTDTDLGSKWVEVADWAAAKGMLHHKT